MRRRETLPRATPLPDPGMPGTVISCTPVILGKKAPVPPLRGPRKRHSPPGTR